ncbi:MAG: DnaJ domain-containing protein, partial [Azonexus sp.]|nr:DnaJ domain-containing protein [Azonexus sp.]
MANTLYDLLEVSATASPESIAASHQRLRAHFLDQQAAGDEDATNRLIALREAFATLSDTVRRQAYDDRLAARSAGEPMAEEPPHSFAKILIG